MKQFLLFTFWLISFFAMHAQSARINEFHYDDDGADDGEFVEVFIANPQPADLSTYTITLYNGSNGSSYGSETLDNTTATTVTGGTVYVWSPSSIQNGGPDGIALSDASGLIEFISYEGDFAAVDGPASGVTSTDIGVTETNSTPEGQSLQFDGTGWVGPQESNPGALNGTTSSSTCSITDISLANQSTCNDNSTPNDATDDFYTADITVTFENAPTTGTLDLSGDATASVAVSALGSATSHTFTAVQIVADGNAKDITATFSAESSCTLTENGVAAVASCSTPPTTPTVTLSVDNNSISENGGTATVTATLSATTSSDVSIELVTSGTATASDYSLSVTTIVISAGSTSATATLTGTDDGITEADETVIIDIDAVAGADEDGTQQVTITLQDDDAQSSITAMATCAGATDNTFHILVSGLTSSVSYDISIDGTQVAAGLTGVTTFTTTTPISFVDGKTKSTVEVNDGSNMTTIEVNEILCEDIDADGNLDNATVLCVDNDGEALYQAAPHTGDNVVVYVLTDATGIVQAVNYSGRFTDLADGNYEIYPVNVADETDAATLVGELTAGTDVDSDDDDVYDFSPTANICEIGCGFVAFMVDCDCPLSITTQPIDETVCAGADASFSVAADPTADVTISWEVSTDGGSTFTAIAPAKSGTTLTLSGATTDMDGYQYRAVITYDNGTTSCMLTSDPATLTVTPRPTIEITTDNLNICSTDATSAIDIAATVSNGTLAWTTTEGTDLSGTTTSPLSYTVSDINNSPITITATVTGADACSAVMVSDQMTIEIENVSCIQFPWDGN